MAKGKINIGGLQLPNNNTELLIIGGLAVGAYAFVVHPLLVKLGVFKSAEQQMVEDVISSGANTNPFDPNFWRQQTSTIFTPAVSDNYAKQIYDAFGPFNDNEEQVFSVFRALPTQAACSFLAERFALKYKQDLLPFLMGGYWPQDRLSAADVASIIKIVQSKPKFKV